MKNIVQTPHARVQVEAVPGAGKTTTLALRVKYLINGVGVRPEDVLALSFANSTVEDFKTKLSAALGLDVASRVDVRTVHSCARAIAGKDLADELRGQDKSARFKAMLSAAIPKAERMNGPWREFKHILVDEYQDCSPEQAQLIAALAQNIPNLMVVGDERQSIYGFGGARHAPISESLTGVRSMRLNLSHRLTRQNADLAQSLFKTSSDGEILTERDGPRPVLVIDTQLRHQLTRIVTDVKGLIGKGVDPMEIAILSPLKAPLRAVEAALLAQGIPTDRIGRDVSLRHVLKVAYLAHAAMRRDKTPIRLADLRHHLEHLDPDKSALRHVRERLRKMHIGALEGVYRECINIYLQLIGDKVYKKEVKRELARWTPVSRQFRTSAQFSSFVRQIAKEPHVQTSTIHKAKGRQWNHVLVVGVIDGLMPVYKTFGKGKEVMAEQRRLLYVAVTRARETLRLYESPVRHAPARTKFDQHCRFVTRPIKLGLLDVVRSEPLRSFFGSDSKTA